MRDAHSFDVVTRGHLPLGKTRVIVRRSVLDTVKIQVDRVDPLSIFELADACLDIEHDAFIL